MCSFGVTNICIFSANLVKHKKVRLNTSLEIDLFTDRRSSSYAFNESHIVKHFAHVPYDVQRDRIKHCYIDDTVCARKQGFGNNEQYFGPIVTIHTPIN